MHSTRQKLRGGRTRTKGPSLELLEQRIQLSITFQFADPIAVGPVGSIDVQSNAATDDAAGDVFVTGSLVGSADFDPGPSVDLLSSSGGRDLFVAKYTPTGALVWAVDVPGAAPSAVAQGSAVAVDPAGEVVVAGTLTGSSHFGPASGGVTLSSPARNDPFVAKFSASGSLVWARNFAGAAGSLDQADALAFDPAGDVVVGGSFQGTAAFGTTALTSTGVTDGFVAKLDPSGAPLWATATVGSAQSVAQSDGLAVDPSGNIIDTGFNAGAVGFDPSSAVPPLSSAGSRDAYVRKLDPGGKLLWVKGFGGPDIDQGNGVTADALGNIYLTGVFSDTVDFDPGAGVTDLTAGGYEDGFLMKLDPAGKFQWADDLGGTVATAAAQGTGVGVDGSGDVVVAGYTSGALRLGPLLTLSNAGGYDAFVAQYSPDGGNLGGVSAGGSGFDAAFGLGVNANGTVAIAGRTTGPAHFGPITLPATSGKSIFVAALREVGPAPAAPPAPTLDPASDTGLSHTDGLTDLKRLTFDVTGATLPSASIQLLRDGAVVASRVGDGTVTDPGPVPDGAHAYTSRLALPASLTSPPSAATTVTVDTQAPATPAPPTLLPADDSGVKGDGLTNVRSPHLIGTVMANSPVELVGAGGVVLATTTSGGDGSYSLTPAAPLADGAYAYRVVVGDAAGNLSAPSAPLNLVIDATPPAAPSPLTLLAADDSGVKGDGLTSVNRPRLTGKAEAGSTVALLDGNGKVLGQTVASAADGSFTVQPTAALADGPVTLKAQAADAAGNLSPVGPGLTLIILTTPPAAPAAPNLFAADDTGPPGDGKTSVRQPRLVGTTLPGVTVDLLDPNGAVLASTTSASGTGAYTLKPASPLAWGTDSLRVRADDAAGNLGAPSPALKLTIVDSSAGDFDGDGKTDLGVFRVATAQWITRPTTVGKGSVASVYGAPGLADIPVPGDYDGLGHAEQAYFNPASARWTINSPTGPRTITYGAPNLFDIPVPGDYDGVGRTELAVFRPSTAQWFVLGPNGGHLLTTFGAQNLHDIPVPGDYHGVGRTEPAVFRPSTAQWFVLGPNGSHLLASFGAQKLADLPLLTSTASLVRLGVAGPAGGIHLSSWSRQFRPTRAADVVAPARPPAPPLHPFRPRHKLRLPARPAAKTRW